MKLTNKKGFTLIPLIVIYIFIFLMVKDFIWEKPKLKSPGIEEYSGYEVTIEWKKGMKNSPETIEVIRVENAFTQDNCLKMAVYSNGQTRAIPLENLISWNLRKYTEYFPASRK